LNTVEEGYFYFRDGARAWDPRIDFVRGMESAARSVEDLLYWSERGKMKCGKQIDSKIKAKQNTW
jgi:hypothetical protein